MNQLLKSQNFQPQIATSNQLMEHTSFKNLIKEFSTPQFQQLRNSIDSTFKTNINFASQLTSINALSNDIFEDFNRQMNRNIEIFRNISQLNRLKLPNTDMMTMIISDHDVVKMNDMKVTSVTDIETYSTNMDENITNESVKDNVQQLTSQYFEAVWSYIVTVNKGTLGTTAEYTYNYYLSGSDWFTFFSILTAVQFAIFVAGFEPNEKIEEKIK